MRIHYKQKTIRFVKQCYSLAKKEEDLNLPQCSQEIEEKSLNLMKQGINPADSLDWHFHGIVPIFSRNFLGQVLLMLTYFPEPGSCFLEYLIEGNSHNTDRLPWDQILTNLISHFPNTLGILDHCFQVPHLCKYELRSLFIHIGGVKNLYIFSQDPTFHNVLSSILKSLSTENIFSYTEEPSIPIQIEVYHDENLFPTIDECETSFELSFSQFCENLLSSTDKETRINTLNSLGELSHQKTSFNDSISSLLLYFFESNDQADEQILTLRILAVTLQPLNFAYLGKIWEVLRNLIANTDDIDIIDTICTFLCSNFEKYGSIFLIETGIIDNIVSLLVSDLPFSIKQNATLILLNIANSCSVQQLLDIVTDDIFTNFLSFLYTEDIQIITKIFHFITRILKVFDDKEHLYDLIYPFSDVVCKFLVCDDLEIKYHAHFINKFMIEFGES